VVLAVSGGSDSAAMLWLFRYLWKGNVVVAHLEHGIRGESSVSDASFVEDLCKKWEVPFIGGKVSVPNMKRKGESIEQAARRLRYDFLNKAKKSCSGSFVALAHTADDVAETVLYNLARGTGPYGLVGIPDCRDIYVRPVIGFYREELRDILRGERQDWRDDETNDDITITRNRIRHELIPWMEEYLNSRSREHIVSTADNMWFARENEELVGDSLLNCSIRYLPYGIVTLDMRYLRKLGENTLRVVLRRLGHRAGLGVLSYKRLIILTDLIYSSGRFRFQWERDIEIVAGQGNLSLVRRKDILSRPFDSFTLEVSKRSIERSFACWSVRISPEDSYKCRERSGYLQTFRYFDPEDSLHILALSENNYPKAKVFLEIIPWWLHTVWPMVEYKDGTIWVPVPDCNSDFTSNFGQCDHSESPVLYRLSLENKMTGGLSYE